ncbi:MAG: hypothetical protein GOMPHAMPRED_004255 [Gomphillus americanus]|uniref:Uncharacterized protein n=1 Tax=Gomphillus americanus TaxID=1940652 RepID=A0A8H3FKS5_9LECA|nr:MAG: hypothetical protein GOMPHAMPRED_004255 [Gomphillus americanus]
MESLLTRVVEAFKAPKHPLRVKDWEEEKVKRNHMLGILSLNNPEAVQVHIKKAEVLSAELKIMGTAIDKQVGSPVEFKEVDPGVSKHWSSWKSHLA